MSNALRHWMNQQEVPIPQWTAPEQFDFNIFHDRDEVNKRFVGSTTKVVHRVAQIADDLFELRHPDQKDDLQKDDLVARQRFVDSIIKEGDRFGKWHYFSWSNSLVQYPDEQTHRELLTFRNRELITEAELRKIGSVTVAHVGLSVGSHILEQTSHMGLGRKVILADPDILSVSNLNRIDAGMSQVGMRKTDVAGIKLSELNPYVEQIHLPEGLTPQNAKTLYDNWPDLIYEEVDHMPTKLLMRRLAYGCAAPLIMAGDIGELSMIDIERFDQGEYRPFLGKLSDYELNMIESGNLSPEQNREIMFKHIGKENVSERLDRSLGQIGLTLGGIAQLNSTASAGAAYAAVYGRNIILGRGLATGRYKISPEEA